MVKRFFSFALIILLIASVIFFVFCMIERETIKDGESLLVDNIVSFSRSLINGKPYDLKKTGKFIFEEYENKEDVYSGCEAVFDNVFQDEDSKNLSEKEREDYNAMLYNAFIGSYISSYFYDSTGELVNPDKKIIFSLLDKMLPELLERNAEDDGNNYYDLFFFMYSMPHSNELVSRFADLFGLYMFTRDNCDYRYICECLRFVYDELEFDGGLNDCEKDVRNIYSLAPFYYKHNKTLPKENLDSNGEIEPLGTKEEAVEIVSELFGNPKLNYSIYSADFKAFPKRFSNGELVFTTYTDGEFMVIFFGEPVFGACLVDAKTGEMYFADIYEPQEMYDRVQNGYIDKIEASED